MYAIKQSKIFSDAILDFKIIGITNINRIYSDEGVQENEYTVLCDIKIDKKSIILKDIKKAELYITSKEAEEILHRSLERSPESINEFNTTVVNGNLNRLNKLKKFFFQDIDTSDLRAVDEIDLSLNLDKSVTNKVKSKRISDADAFGFVEKYEITERKPSRVANNSETKKQKDYFETVSDDLIDNIDKSNPRNMFSLMNKLKKSGISIVSGNISGLEKYIEQERLTSSRTQKIAGNFNRIFYKENRHPLFKNLINYIKTTHLRTAKALFSQESNKALSVVKEINRIESLKKSFIFKKSLLRNGMLGSLIVVLYDKVGLKSEVKITDFNLASLENKYAYPDFNYEFSVSKEDNKKIVGNICNKEHKPRKFIVTYETVGENNLNQYDTAESSIVYNNEKIINVPPYASKFFTILNNYKHKNYAFYLRMHQEGESFANAKFAFCKSKQNIFQSKTAYVDFVCLNKNRGIDIIIRNLDFETRSVNILRKNLTKKQKKFKKISTNILLNGNNRQLSFLDTDAEDKDVYEYKVEKVSMGGMLQTSSNSYIEKYCADKNLGLLTSTIAISESSQESITYLLNVNYEPEEDDINKVIKALTGNLFSLFEKVLEQLNSNAGIVGDIVVSAYDHITGEVTEFAAEPLQDNRLEFAFTLPRSTYTLKVASRIGLPQDLIKALSEAQQNFVNVSDVFLNKETGDFSYFYLDSLSNDYKGAEIQHGQESVTFVKSTLQSTNAKKKNISFFDYYEASFQLKHYYNLDYFVMSYVENNFMPIIYGLGYTPRFNNQSSTFYKFTYKIPETKGFIAFIAQPVYIDGNLGKPFVVGSITKD